MYLFFPIQTYSPFKISAHRPFLFYLYFNTKMRTASVVADAAQKVVSFALAGGAFVALTGISLNIYMNTGKNRKRRTNLVDTTAESATATASASAEGAAPAASQ